jgi:hypothetical protein
MLPKAQALRLLIHVFPFAGNAALLVPYMERSPSWKRFPATRWLLLVFLLLTLELLHPSTAVIPGLAQVAYSFCLSAPAFWGGKAIRDKQRIDRILYLTFVFAATNATVGFVQGKYGVLMPAEFSSFTKAIEPWRIQQLTYTGASGQTIIRPPGLSDLPAGGAMAATYTIILGTALALGAKRFGVKSIGYLGAVAIAMVTLYLTQVRVLLIAAVVGLLLVSWAVGRYRLAYSARMIIVSGAALAVAFTYAVSVGGKSVSERLASLVQQSPTETYNWNRGYFITETVEDLLPQYPFGAGLGRWGMARLYTRSYLLDTDPPEIWAEIQPTGWLLDGGFMMWILYGAAIISSLAYAYRAAKMHPDREIRFFAGLILALNSLTVLMVWDAPAFNTLQAAQFWMLSSGLAGVCES